MQVIEIDDLRVANRASLYSVGMSDMAPILDMNSLALSNIIQNANHSSVQNAIDFANHYMSDNIMEEINDISNSIGYSADVTHVLYDGNLSSINDLGRLSIMSDTNIYELIEDGQLHGYGYEFDEHIEDTALYNNINGNVATNYRDMCLYVDSSEYDIDLKSYLNINDMVEEAYKIINDDEDFTKVTE